jgi:hypothetical protein
VAYNVDAGEELKNEVESIPACVELSRHMIVVCPPCHHTDVEDTFIAIAIFECSTEL